MMRFQHWLQERCSSDRVNCPELLPNGILIKEFSLKYFLGKKKEQQTGIHILLAYFYSYLEPQYPFLDKIN